MMHIKFLVALASLPALVLASYGFGEIKPPLAGEGWVAKRSVIPGSRNQSLVVEDPRGEKVGIKVSIDHEKDEIVVNTNGYVVMSELLNDREAIYRDDDLSFKLSTTQRILVSFVKKRDRSISVCRMANVGFASLVSSGHNPMRETIYDIPIIKDQGVVIEPTVISCKGFIVNDVILPTGWKYEWIKSSSSYLLKLSDYSQESSPTNVTIAMGYEDSSLSASCSNAAIAISQGDDKMIASVNEDVSLGFDGSTNIRVSVALGGKEGSKNLFKMAVGGLESRQVLKAGVAIIEISPDIEKFVWEEKPSAEVTETKDKVKGQVANNQTKKRNRKVSSRTTERNVTRKSIKSKSSGSKAGSKTASQTVNKPPAKRKLEGPPTDGTEPQRKRKRSEPKSGKRK